MDYQQLVAELTTVGMTQAQIARACACGQSTISDIRKGKTPDPRASTALALIKLARRNGVRVAIDDLVDVHAGESPGSSLSGQSTDAAPVLREVSHGA
ncbi:hypothetical protein SNE35_28750 [Paucibacter sp. R3-3]|uniref:HTH cro/C1-type domain-containing protein n=2 Tax=Roseateles agri TaxID=3098619 RepID=A0ABU5DQZ2_9BURK|nr:hypothetical protein [Paucibacter sp. R3-3]MDY0748524.1 hypothetical protein [Paucibacter sp. R3-3]